MKRYQVVAEVTISVSVVVEARSKKHARDLANKAGMATLCHYCESGEYGEWTPSNGLDGEPKIISVEEA